MAMEVTTASVPPFETMQPSTVTGDSPHRTSSSGQWSKTLQYVRERGRLQGLLARKSPSNFQWRQLTVEGKKRSRLYFLGIGAGERENALLYVDVPIARQDNEDIPTLAWGRLVEKEPEKEEGGLSREEALLRERRRVSGAGVTSYTLHPDTGLFILPSPSSRLFRVDDLPIAPLKTGASGGGKGGGEGGRKAVCLETTISGPLMDPKICPSNPSLLAFVHQHDLWLYDLPSGPEIRLTYTRHGESGLEHNALSAGVAPFIVQEEFDRYTGYWWQPPTPDNDVGIYRLLYEEVDETDVEIFRIASEDGKVDEYRYPRAGTPNAVSNLRVCEIQVTEDGDLYHVTRELESSLKTLLPWAEYVLRAGWTPNGQHVWVHLLDRSQRRTAVVIFSLDAFKAPQPAAGNNMEVDGHETKGFQVLLEEKTDVWFTAHDATIFLPDHDNDDTLSFIWCSARSGYKHLYLVESRVGAADDVTCDGLGAPHDPYTQSLVSCSPLTDGPWEVVPSGIVYEPSRRCLYFSGLKDSVLEHHLYCVFLSHPLTVLRLTDEGLSHSATVSQDGDYYVTVCSALDVMPYVTVHTLEYSTAADSQPAVASTPLAHVIPPADLPSDYTPPQLLTLESSSGCDFHCLVFPPANPQPGTKYPTVLSVYAGPEVQRVTNQYKGSKFMKQHTLAASGFCVVMCDGRGSSNRGMDFEGHIKDCLGQNELDDQVEALEWLSSKLDYMDMSRVAVHGWSYGGYVSLMALVQQPSVFKVAIAGAPVTSWTFYDTGYTERYMGRPDENPVGYSRGSVLEQAHKFPRDQNRLLIVHGLADENVHFRHTQALVAALVKCCRPHLLQVYPGERHGLRSSKASEHYETLVLTFLKNNL